MKYITITLAEEVVFIKEKVDAEFELAYKNIRKVSFLY